MLRIPCPAVNLPESCRFERYASVANGEAYLTKSNIWTLFGAPVLYHMGGSVVSCTLLTPGDGVVLASGAIPVYGGFVKSSEVGETLQQLLKDR